MKNLLLKLLKNYYILILLGLSYIIFFLWGRYIRERVPRDIPFQATWYIFIFLFVICLVYAYILLRLWVPKDPHPLLIRFLSWISFIRKPIDTLDGFIRESYYGFKMVDKIFLFTSKKVKKYNFHTDYDKNGIVLNIIFILPKILLVFIFIIDVFYHSKLENFYKCIWLSLFIIICDYILHILQKHLEYYLDFLEDNFEIEMLSEDGPGSGKFYLWPIEKLIYVNDNNNNYGPKQVIEYQSKNIIFEYDIYIFSPVEKDQAPMRNPNNQNKNLYNDIEKDYKEQFEKIYQPCININCFLYCFNDMKNSLSKKEILSNKYPKETYILSCIYIGYLIGWSFIFMVTFFNMDIMYDIIINSIEILEPFSGSGIFF